MVSGPDLHDWRRDDWAGAGVLEFQAHSTAHKPNLQHRATPGRSLILTATGSGHYCGWPEIRSWRRLPTTMVYQRF
jgi:hypothetical protein